MTRAPIFPEPTQRQNPLLLLNLRLDSSLEVPFKFECTYTKTAACRSRRCRCGRLLLRISVSHDRVGRLRVYLPRGSRQAHGIQLSRL